MTGLVKEEKPAPPPMADRLPFLKPIMSRFLPAADPVVVEHEIGEEFDGRLPAVLCVIDTPGHVSFLLERDGGLLSVGNAAVAKNGVVKRGYMNRSEPTFDAGLRHIAEYEYQGADFGHAAPLL